MVWGIMRNRGFRGVSCGDVMGFLCGMPGTGDYRNQEKRSFGSTLPFFRPVEILVEADNREPVLLCNSILVRIIKIQVKPVCRPGDL